MAALPRLRASCCLRHHPRETWDAYLTCARGIGTFMIASFVIADIGPYVQKAADPKARDEWTKHFIDPPNNFNNASCGL